MLDLGEVRECAEVKVNGMSFPALWKPPYRVDITDAIRRVGDNAPYQGGCQNGRAACPQAAADVIDLEIKVANLWPNRLIGDDALYLDDCRWNENIVHGRREFCISEIPQWVRDGRTSPTGRHTFTTFKHWTKDDELLPSGLIGPVVIRFGEVYTSVRGGRNTSAKFCTADP